MSQLPNNNINSPCQKANSDSCPSLEDLMSNENSQSNHRIFIQVMKYQIILMRILKMKIIRMKIIKIKMIH